MRPGDAVLSERETARSAAIMVAALGAMAFVAVIALRLEPHRRAVPGFNEVAIAGLGLIGLAFALILPRFPAIVAPRRLPIALTSSVVFVTLPSYYAGPVIGPYVLMSYLWIGMVAHLFLNRKLAFAIIGWAGVAYAILLWAQPGNDAPVTRWILVMGAMNVSGFLVGGLADRIHDLVEEERRLRREVEDARRDLEVATRQRSDFLAGMSHELRTPLNAIIGFADVLAERLFGPLTGAQDRLVGDIRRAGGTLLGLADDVLDIDPGPPADVERREGQVRPAVAEHDRIIRADPRGAFAFFVLAPLGMITLPRTQPGMRVWSLILIVAVGLVVDMWVLLSRRITEPTRAWLHITVVTLTTLGMAIGAGPVISPFVTIFFMWMTTAAAIRLRDLSAVLQLTLIAVSEAVVVLAQPGNAAPFLRWEITIETAFVSAFLVRTIVNRLFRAAEKEAEARAVADEARAELETADQHKVEFLRNVRHDLRAPIDEVTDAANLLLAGTAGRLRPKQAEYAADVASASRHLWTLITDVLDLATLESGRMGLELDRVNLRDVVHAGVAGYEGSAAAAGVHLDIQVEPERVTVWADRDKLRRAIAGLVSNAVKFTPTGGIVRVRGSVGAGEMVIAVTDTGPGIPAEDRTRIFEGFQQGRPAAAAPGMGVGLTLARRFVELQGGRIELESEGGVGSTFTITLPCPDHPAPLAPGGAGTLAR